MTPTARPRGHTPEIPSASPLQTSIYKSTRPLRQVRFPGRRKVVKTYSLRRSTRSPKQQTLTQVGYVLAAATKKGDAGLWHNRPQEGKGATVKDAGDEHSSGGVEKDGVNQGDEKHHTVFWRPSKNGHVSSPQAKPTMQFVSGEAEAITYGGIDKGFRTSVVEDSEDETEARSPEARNTDAIRRLKEPASPPLSVVPQTPTKQRTHCSGANSNNTTPPTVRSEIPSSQPSPFTPILFPGRYHSPLGRLKSSPLKNKSGKSVGDRDTESTTIQEDSPDQIAREVVPVVQNCGSVAAIPVPCCVAESHNRTSAIGIKRSAGSHRKRPLLVVQPTQIKNRGFSKGSGPILSLSSAKAASTAVDEDEDDDCTNIGQQGKQEDEIHFMEEIPDTDEEEELSGMNAVGVIRTSPVATRPAAVSPSDITKAILPSDWEPGNIFTPPRKGREDMNNQGSRQKVQRAVKQEERVQPQFSASYVDASAPDTTLDPAGQIPGIKIQHSQSLESQRVPLETIRDLGPQTDRSDIIILVQPEQARDIIGGTQDHEFRNYKIPQTVCRFWLYIDRPICELQYMAVVKGGFRQPGDIDSNSGEGNAAFNARQIAANFAYKLAEVYQLNNPVPLETMKHNGWVDGPPQRYTYVPPAVVGALLANLRCRLLVNGQSHAVGDSYRRLDGTAEEVIFIPQELETQLLVDISDRQQRDKQRLVTPRELGRGVRQRTAEIYEDEASKKCGGDGGTRPLQAMIACNPSKHGTHTCDHGKVDEAAETGLGAQDFSPLLWDETFTSRPPLDLCISGGTYVLESTGVDSGSGLELDRDMRQMGVATASQKIHSQQARGQQQQQQHACPYPLLQSSLSNDSTQVLMPDSLYEEVRQAPPAVILDSEEEDEGDE